MTDDDAAKETAYLLRSPANAAKLRESIKQYEQVKNTKPIADHPNQT